ncbi:MAG: hypothetical protein FWF52_01640 [Candidatus Azobacteroides sp.]|nr:hypothetical protein [Candidatus Azobacteroides sp.]
MRKFMVIVLSCASVFSAGAQEAELSPIEEVQRKIEDIENQVIQLNKLKISGFIQAQYQYGEAAADGINFKLAKKANAYESSAFYPGTTDYKGLDDFNRFGIRCGRFKFTYEEGIVSGVAQIDITDKGINDPNVPGRNVVLFKDLYIHVKDPWIGSNSFRVGVFERSFGNEIDYSSSRRETPERGRAAQSIFPEERDLGLLLTLQAAKTSAWNFLKLEAGLFTGNGIKPQIDNHMDFLGRLSATKNIGSNASIRGGVSFYRGGVLQSDSSTYEMRGNRFVLESDSRTNIGKLAKRQYLGFDVQFNMITEAGLSQIRGEYVFGEQPGTARSSYSFGLDDIPSGPVYMRNVRGGYVLLVQDLGRSPLTALAKYDWYDPNTGVSGNNIAAPNLLTNETDQPTVAGAGDVAMSNIGVGLVWRINSALKLTAYYDFVSNEKTKNSKNSTVSETDSRITQYGWEGNRKDNVFTLRLQYKF